MHSAKTRIGHGVDETSRERPESRYPNCAVSVWEKDIPGMTLGRVAHQGEAAPQRRLGERVTEELATLTTQIAEPNMAVGMQADSRCAFIPPAVGTAPCSMQQIPVRHYWLGGPSKHQAAGNLGLEPCAFPRRSRGDTRRPEVQEGTSGHSTGTIAGGECARYRNALLYSTCRACCGSLVTRAGP